MRISEVTFKRTFVSVTERGVISSRRNRVHRTSPDATWSQDNGADGHRRCQGGCGHLTVVELVMPRQSASPFTQQERDLIRLELMPRFGQDPDLANGLFLRTWHSGPQKGQPKIPKAIQTMLDPGNGMSVSARKD